MIRGHRGSVDAILHDMSQEFLHDTSGDKFRLRDSSDPLAISWHHLRTTTDTSSPDRDQPMLEGSFILEIPNPRARLVYGKHMDIFNMVGLWIYMLSGSENVHPIEFYNPIARRFVDEGSNPVRLRATWGSRIFGSGALDHVIRMLRETPQTRRAVLPVFDVSDVGYSSRNLPCLSLVQFSVAEGRLHCYVYLRSQAAIGVMPYDLFLLTMLHEYVSMRTGIPLGEYTHFAPLCGVREREIPILHEIVSKSPVNLPMAPMEDLAAGQLALFHMCERKIRRTGVLPEEFNLLPPYWRSFLLITNLKRCENTQFASKAVWKMFDFQTAFPYEFIAENLKHV